MPVPLVLPADLPPATRRVYRAHLDRGRSLQRLTDAERDAADAISAAQLGELGLDGAYLIPWAVSEHFSVADDGSDSGDGLYAEVRLQRYPHPDRSYDPLLTALFGATLSRVSSSAPYPTWRLEVRHAHATDFEHSPVILADITIGNPVLTDIGGTGTVLVGQLIAADLWPYGTDPLTVSDRDTTAGTCTSCDEPHPLAAYMPGGRDELAALAGSLVRITTVPRASVDNTGRLLHQPADS